MARAILIEERDQERDYQISDGQIITIRLEDVWGEMSFWKGKTKIGDGDDFVFIEIEHLPNSYLLARMYVPIKNKGLGRAAIEFFKEIEGATIYCRPNDGRVRNDGSHLTEDALGFVAKMIQEGLIEPNDTDVC